MIELDLFIGFPVDPLYSGALDKANPHLRAQFIQNSDEYLCEVVKNEMRFIGKNLGEIATLSQIDLIGSNIYSILKKLVPDFPYDETPLYLFSLKKECSPITK